MGGDNLCQQPQTKNQILIWWF